MLVYEIVAQREPHTDKDPNQIAILIRCVFEFVFEIELRTKERELILILTLHSFSYLSVLSFSF
jgi:hypothetical protein